MCVTASATILHQKPHHTLPSHPSPCQPLCIRANTHVHFAAGRKKKKKHAKILSFHSHTHTRPKTINTFLSLCLACASVCTWPPDGRTGGRGGEGFFAISKFALPSVSTSCGALNEITVIQIERREAKIQMLFSSSPVSDSAPLSATLSSVDYGLSSAFLVFSFIYMQRTRVHAFLLFGRRFCNQCLKENSIFVTRWRFSTAPRKCKCNVGININMLTYKSYCRFSVISISAIYTLANANSF